MKRVVLALVACFLIVGFFPILDDLTASPTSDKQAADVTAQGSIVNQAKLVVKGPTKVKIGDLVVISVGESRAESFKWIIMPSTDNFLVIDQGKRVVFSSGSEGEFKFIVACSLGNTCDVAVHTVMVGGTPTVISNFGSKVAQWCEFVDSDTKRDEVLALSHSFATVAIAMETGPVEFSPEEIIRATYEANQKALGDKLEAWLPFREALAEELFHMSQTGKLTDKQSHIEVWKLLAKALREYAETL